MVVGLVAGVKLVIPVGKFEPEKAMQLIEDEQISVWATVPTMVWRVVEHPDRHNYDLSSITTIAYGGSPSADELQRKVRETFPNVTTLGNAYGLTESSSVATGDLRRGVPGAARVGRSADAGGRVAHRRRGRVRPAQR